MTRNYLICMPVTSHEPKHSLRKLSALWSVAFRIRPGLTLGPKQYLRPVSTPKEKRTEVATTSPAAPLVDARATSTMGLVGNTPLVRLESLGAGLQSEIYVKLESAIPGGSVKDRTALSMIREAEQSGVLKPGAHDR